MANIAIPTIEHPEHARHGFAKLLRGWLRDMLDGLMSPGQPDDPLARLAANEWADMPTHHPVRDE